MKSFNDFLMTIDNEDHKRKTQEVLQWVSSEFPHLAETIKWNQPMFMDHGTFIIGFSVAKNHLAVSPERKGIIKFSKAIQAAGYNHAKMIIRFPWEKPIDYALLKEIIAYNIQDKVNCTTFWRK